jgi:hypothetical protein
MEIARLVVEGGILVALVVLTVVLTQLLKVQRDAVKRL